MTKLSLLIKRKKTKIKPKSNPSDNHFPFLLSQSLISRHFTQFRRVNLLLGVEFAVDEEALPPFHQFLRFLRFSPSVSLFLSCSLSLSSVSCRGNLAAIHAGNRGYPPNKVVCTEGPDRVRELIAIGASFDHREDGNLHLVREGGHSHRRIVHAADMAGKEIERALLKSVVNPNIFVFEHHLAINLLTCQVVRFLSNVTLLALGGAGHIYPKTTNPLVATGDGIAMAHRVQAVISNME
ncbi:L-aspartate oxidase, chloroplastic-like isoform X4 [Arachis stenosperma]|uniref:L-aspartate oxidase, chloroplastic-like isoform X4 n=1 Tax=Arachis stenosperma TaxID=217475 RepID=UPI0025AB6435|nr:L-aspartate oxidase, chloroplastic-like isoform X4 [Arachis stenosperma]